MHHRSRQLQKSLQVLPNLATPALRRELHATRCESLSSRYCPKDNWSDVYSDNLCAGKVASSPDKSIIGTSSKDFGSTILACESAAYARRSPHHTNWIPPPHPAHLQRVRQVCWNVGLARREDFCWHAASAKSFLLKFSWIALESSTE